MSRSSRARAVATLPRRARKLDGTLHTGTGKLLLAGTVTSGWMLGARVQSSGQLTGIDPSTGGTVFVGSVRIFPNGSR